MPLAPLRNDSTHPSEGAIRAPERTGAPRHARRVLVTAKSRRGRRLNQNFHSRRAYSRSSTPLAVRDVGCGAELGMARRTVRWRYERSAPRSALRLTSCSTTQCYFWVTSGSGACRARPGGRTQSSWKRLSGMDAAKAAMGHGWPTAAGLWNGDGVSEPSRSEGRMIGRRVWLLCPQSDSPGRAKPETSAKTRQFRTGM